MCVKLLKVILHWGKKKKEKIFKIFCNLKAIVVMILKRWASFSFSVSFKKILVVLYKGKLN